MDRRTTCAPPCDWPIAATLPISAALRERNILAGVDPYIDRAADDVVVRAGAGATVLFVALLQRLRYLVIHIRQDLGSGLCIEMAIALDRLSRRA